MPHSGGGGKSSSVQLEIDTRNLNNDIETLQEKLKSLRDTQQQMESSMNELYAMWDGEAKNAEQQQFQSDIDTLSNMEDIIQKLITKLQTASQKYDSAENNVGGVISSISV